MKFTPEYFLARCKSPDSPQDILQAAFDAFPEDAIAVSFSGSEDVVLVDMAVQLRSDVRVFCLDTGRLHPETYQFIDMVRRRYRLNLEILLPDPIALGSLVREKGLFSFYEDGHHECCALRKVEPLRRYLEESELDAWVTGQRQDQSIQREVLPIVQRDEQFSSEERQILKFNPLAQWSSAQVWEYIWAHELPQNALHSKGYVSIGCEPCTRSILPHQHEREGRWWWEDDEVKECGLHETRPPDTTTH